VHDGRWHAGRSLRRGVCSRLIGGIVGSKLTEGMSLCVVLLRRADHSSRGVLPGECVCVCVCCVCVCDLETSTIGVRGPVWAVAPQKTQKFKIIS